MRVFIAITDNDWFVLHVSKEEVEDVDFWRRSLDSTFEARQPGELLLFKLCAPDNFIAGGGFFASFLRLLLTLAWDVFGETNGPRSLGEMQDRIARYRRVAFAPNDNPTIGCIMLAEPFFRRHSD